MGIVISGVVSPVVWVVIIVTIVSPLITLCIFNHEPPRVCPRQLQVFRDSVR